MLKVKKWPYHELICTEEVDTILPKGFLKYNFLFR